MNDIEKRAVECLAEAYRQKGQPGLASLIIEREGRANSVWGDVALNAIIAALTPPEGYEQALQDAARYWYIRDIAAGEPSAFAQIEDAAFAAHYGNAAQFDINIDDQMAARPEVSP